MLLRRALLPFLLGITFLLATMGITPEARTEQMAGILQRVVDGDTIVIKTNPQAKNTNVRLLNIDTPETNYEGLSQGKLAEDAKVFLSDLLPVGSRVLLELGPEEKDMYGRTLAIVFHSGQDINKAMLRSGLAIPYIIHPNSLNSDAYLLESEKARSEKLGIYDPDETTEIPYEWRRRVSDRTNTYFTLDVSRNCYVLPEDYKTIDLLSRIFYQKEKDLTREEIPKC